MEETEESLPLLHHMEELRSTIIRILGVVIVSVVICFFNYDFILTFLQKPLYTNTHQESLQEERLEYIRVMNPLSLPKIIVLPTDAALQLSNSSGIEQTSSNAYVISPGGSLVYSKVVAPTSKLVLLGPLEGILMALKTSFWVGIVGSSPLWLWILMKFITPGLRVQEKRLALAFLTTSLAFIVIGCLFTFFVTIPIANGYLFDFNQGVGVNLWSLERYMDYTLFLLLANGAAFELGAVGIFAVHLGFVSAETLVEKRRPAILVAFIIATILTPPDVLTQLLLAIPLMGLYEGLIIYARIQERWRRQEEKSQNHDFGICT